MSDTARLQYTLVLDDNEYATIMRLVMKHGTGASQGDTISTSTHLRVKLADAKVSRVEPEVTA